MGTICLISILLFMFLFGLYGLIAGRIKVTDSSLLTGWAARRTGLLVMAPLVFYLGSSFVVNLLELITPLPSGVYQFIGLSSCASIPLVLIIAHYLWRN